MRSLLRLPAKTFNRICVWLAALWLIVTIPLGILYRPTIPDFEQFYMGGVLAMRGDWHALYPIPHPRSLDNPGLRIHSDAKPLWKALSDKLGVWDHTHFMLPPPSALLFVPLSYVSYTEAFWIWTFVQIACIWGVAVFSARLLRYLFGRPTRWQGLLALLIAISPMTARAIRISNVSPPIALALAVTLHALLRESQAVRGAWALVVGAVFKYATLVLAPLLVAMRRWKMLAYLSVFGVCTLLLTYAVAGAAPFIEFYEVILPTLSRPSAFRGNQSLPGMLARIYGRPLSDEITLALNLGRMLTLLGILGALFSIKPQQWRNPVNVFAGCAVLVSWLLVFSPIAWEHWPVFLCPVWGWVIWEATQPGLKRVIAVISLVLMYFPAGIFEVAGFLRYRLALPEPYNSYQLAGVALLLALAFWRLSQQSASAAQDGTQAAASL